MTQFVMNLVVCVIFCFRITVIPYVKNCDFGLGNFYSYCFQLCSVADKKNFIYFPL